MLQIGVCDDNIMELSKTKAFIEQYVAEHHLEAEIHVYTDGSSLLENMNNALDILFLDIELGEDQNGLDIAKEYQENYIHTIIIITSAHKTYISDSYAFENIFQYMLKPFDAWFFNNEMTKALKYYYFQNDFYYFKNNQNEYVPIKFKDIVYIKSQKNFCIIQCQQSTGGQEMFRACFYKQAISLKKYGFLRCHKQYIINLRFVSKFDKETIIMKVGGDTYTIPISKKNYPEIHEKILDFKARSVM